jgi:hypothetical protein
VARVPQLKGGDPRARGRQGSKKAERLNKPQPKVYRDQQIFVKTDLDDLADRINEDAAPGDRVTGERLQDRVRYSEGLKMGNSHNNPEVQEESILPKRENNPQPQEGDPAAHGRKSSRA